MSKKVHHATIIIWNYDSRGDQDGTPQPNNIAEEIVLNKEIISIVTNKQKGEPSGTFRFTLAPNTNWMNRITPGSWCAILMTNDKSAISTKKANIASLKMIGRITSARMEYTADERSGARNKTFMVTGKDWGCAFESILYLDPIFNNASFDPEKALGTAASIAAIQLGTNHKGKTLYRVGDLVRAVLTVWGQDNNVIGKIVSSLREGGDQLTAPSILGLSSGSFIIPSEVVRFMGTLSVSLGGANLASLLKYKEGILVGEDEYDYDNVNDGIGFPDLNTLFGNNSLWTLINGHDNSILTDVVTELFWDGNTAEFGLIRRIKPFCNRTSFDGSSSVSDYISQFNLVRKVAIAKDDVIAIDGGTNWKDRVNFIEIRSILNPRIPEGLAPAMKTQSQIYDSDCISRDGIRIMPVGLSTARYLPFPTPELKDSNKGVINQLTNWKYLLKEWYFNVHTLINGAVSIVGQDAYIGVGDNIEIPASVFGGTFNSTVDPSSDVFLAHVQSVTHSFVSDERGARVFKTDIQFVRGIFTKSGGGGSLLADPISALKELPSKSSQGDVGIDKTATQAANTPEDSSVFTVVPNSSKNNVPGGGG